MEISKFKAKKKKTITYFIRVLVLISQTTNVSSSAPDANNADDGEKQQTRIALLDSCIIFNTCSPFLM